MFIYVPIVRAAFREVKWVRLHRAEDLKGGHGPGESTNV